MYLDFVFERLHSVSNFEISSSFFSSFFPVLLSLFFFFLSFFPPTVSFVFLDFMWYVLEKPCPLSVLVGGHALLAVTLTAVSVATSVVHINIYTV